MAVCDFVYLSGLRAKSGEATVSLSGVELKVVRDGRGRSRPGYISVSELAAELAKAGKSEAVVSVTCSQLRVPLSYLTTIVPSRAMGRQGRNMDAAAALFALKGRERVHAALHQVVTLPSSDSSGRAAATARAAAAFEVVGADRFLLAVRESGNFHALRYAPHEVVLQAVMDCPQELLDVAADVVDASVRDAAQASLELDGLLGLTRWQPRMARPADENLVEFIAAVESASFSLPSEFAARATDVLTGLLDAVYDELSSCLALRVDRCRAVDVAAWRGSDLQQFVAVLPLAISAFPDDQNLGPWYHGVVNKWRPAFDMLRLIQRRMFEQEETAKTADDVLSILASVAGGVAPLLSQNGLG